MIEETCNKDVVTNSEILEAVRMNGIESCWSDDIYISSRYVDRDGKDETDK